MENTIVSETQGSGGEGKDCVPSLYHIQCEDCDEDYVGESGQSLKAQVD